MFTTRNARNKLVRGIYVLAFTLPIMVSSPSGFAKGSAETHGQNGPAATCPAGGQCFADILQGNPFYDFANRLYQQDIISGYPCGGLGEPCDASNRPYYRPGSSVTRAQMTKFVDNARRLPGIYIQAAGGTTPIYVSNTSGQALQAVSQSNNAIYAQTGTSSAVYGQATGAGGRGVEGSGEIGVKGTSASGDGVYGSTGSSTRAGVNGSSTSGYGVKGTTSSGVGVYGGAGSGDGVVGISTSGSGVLGRSTSGLAGYFQGNVQVTGNLSKSGGSFKIDHPLDPENKYLYHSFVESPDMMNVYNGNVTTDANGEAVVALPDWFEALNKDFRYQLTPMGQFAQAIVWQEVKDNKFVIKTDKPNVKVSWQVTGIRQDPYANTHRIPVEEAKPDGERGLYLDPDAYGQPESKRIGTLPEPPSR